MRVRPLSLRGHLVALVLLPLLPMLVLGGTLIGWVADEQRASVEHGLLETAKALALAMDREIDGNLAALQGLAAADSLNQGDLAAFYNGMQLAQRQHPYWANVALLDATGQQILHTAKPVGAPLPNVAHFGFVRQALETGKPTVSDLITGPVAGRLNVAILFPVQREGRLTHILAAVVNPEAWSALLAEFSTAPGTVIVAEDRQNRILARNRDAEAYLGRAMPAWAKPSRDDAATGTARGTAFQGHDVVSAYHRSATSGWTLVVARPTNETDAPVFRTLLLAAALGGTLLLASLALAAAAARRISQPMAALAVAGSELADLKPIAAPASAIPILEIDRLWHDLTDASSKLLRSTRAAQHADARHRSIVDTAMDAIVVMDAGGRITLFNKAAERTFGYAADEVLNQDISALMPEPYRSEHGGLVARYLSTGDSKLLGIVRTFQGQRKNGATFPIEVSLAEWRADGQVFFTAILRDITARVQAERDLRDSHALLNAIIDGVPDPIFVKDRDGSHLLANAALASLLGRSLEDIVGQTDAAFFPPALAERVRAVDQRVMSTGQSVVVEEVVVDSAGAQRHYLSAKVPLHDEQGHVRGVIGIARDITERHRFEAELRVAKNAAERASLAKSKFLAAVSHDLRQPSQSLYLFLGALRARLGKTHPTTDLIDTMQQALDAQKALLDSLVDISRLDAGRIVPQPVPVPLGPLLEHLGREYRLRAEQRGLSLRVVPTQAAVRSDPALLEQMLRNLIENALRHTQRGRILIGGRRRGNQVRLCVIDTGIGITADEQEAIWEEFYQVDNPERDRAKGLGLGLAIVRRLGRLLGHGVGVHSQPGRGSCFFVDADRLVWTPVGHAPAPLRVANDDLRGLVIIVDDEALVRLGFKAMLEGWGYDVLTAGSAAEALDALRQHGACPNLIVADYRLRENRTGTEAIRDIHTHCGVEIPALVITGDTAPERIAEAESAGFALLHKPVGATELHQHVQRIIQRRTTG